MIKNCKYYAQCTTQNIVKLSSRNLLILAIKTGYHSLITFIFRLYRTELMDPQIFTEHGMNTKKALEIPLITIGSVLATFLF